MDEFKSNPTVYKNRFHDAFAQILKFGTVLQIRSFIFLQKFHSHGFVKPTMNKIPIKTERDVERRLELKVEPQSPLQPVQAERKSSTIDWTQQKQTLVNKMIALKAENQQNLLALKKAQSDCDLLLDSKQKLEQIVSEKEASYSVQLREIKLELSNAKSEIVELKSSAEKTISELKRDNQILMARVKQFESGMQQKSAFERCKKRSDSEDDEYEVEAILNHRELKNGWQYLIRWKGYGSSEDSWEKETNLTCPKILNKYKKSNGLNRK